MKPTLRSALGFAVACFVGVATAAPMAHWIDFTGGIANEGDTTSFTIESSGWTLSATGTKNDNGSVTLRDVATLTTTGDGLNAFSLVLDCAKPPATTGNLIQFATSSTEGTKIGRVQSANAVFRLGHGSNSWQSATGNTYTWGDDSRQFITLTHLSNSSTGTRLYANNTEVISYPGLRWDGSKYSYFTVGFDGLTVYGIYLYNSRLADATAVSNELTTIDEIKAAYTATITAGDSVAADALDVSYGTTTKKLSEVVDTETVRLTLAGDATISGAVTAKYLQTTGTGTLTFSEGTLSATSAWVDADVDVSAKALNASLGAVSIAAGNTLTVGASGEPYTTLTAGSAISTVSPVSKLTIKATNENFEATESQLAQLRAFTGVVEFTGTSGSDATGATLTYGSISNGYNNGFKPRFVFNKGQHTLAYGYGWTSAQGGVRWSAGATDAAPTIEVTGGAQLTFKVKDVSGWSGSTGGMPSVLRVGENSQLILTTLSKENGYSNATGYWRDRIVLDRGATVSVEAFTTSGGANNFVLYGGAGDSDLPQLAMLDNQGEAIWNGGFRTDVNASRISIGSNSSLLLNGAITGAQSINKVGAGRLTLTGTNTNSGSLTIAAGTLRFAAAEGSATVGSWAGTVTVNDGATLEVPETAALPATLASASAGTVLLTGDGELDVRSAIATASALKAGFAEGSTGTLIVPAGSEVANLQVPAGATLKLVLSAAQLAAGRYTYSFTQAEDSTVSFWRADAEGNLTEVTGTTEGSTFLPTLSFVFTNATRNGQWTDEDNWSNGAVPSATDAVEIPANTALTLTANVSVASLRVTGSGTLTVTGGTLTVTNTLFVLERLVATSSQLVFGDNLVAINLLGEGTAMDYTVTSAVALPALTGSGTFTKRGSADMTFKNATTAYLAQVVVAEGILDTGEIQTASEFHITVEAGATFLTRSTTSLTSTASILCLKGGAILDLRNGNGNATRPIRAAITINATNDNPAIIQGSRNGNASNLQGAITGKGTLEIRKAPDQTGANAFTISGNISDASAEERLALKVTQTGREAAVTLTGDNDYTGGTTIADGATVIVATIDKLGPSGTVQVDANGTLKLVNSDTLNEEGTDYSRVTGTGTVWYSGSNWRTLPNTAAKRLPTSISVKNDLAAGLIISQWNSNQNETQITVVGSVLGSGTFRADWGWGSGDDSRTLRIVQSKNTEHTDNFINSNGSGRLTKVVVAGADGATEKTLTLSGDTTTARPLEIEASGSVKLTGSWNAKITIDGALEVPVASGTKTISTVLEGTTGTLTKSGAGQLDLTGANTFSGKVAITGGILNVGSNRGFTVSAIESGAKLALSPTESEIAAGQIDLRMANGVTLSAEQLSVTDFPGVTGADGYIYLTNPCWKPTAEDATWANNWYRGTTAMATAPTSGKIEVNFSALTTETEVTIPSGTFDAVTFVGGEAEGCSLVVTLGEGVSLGALTVRGRVTLPDTAIAAATEVTAGATLSLTGSGATISTAITGAGSLCQRSGSTSLTGVNTYTGTTTVAKGATLALAEEGVLSDAFGDGSAVIVNGTLVLATGSYCRRTTGAGTIRVLNNMTFAIGQAALPEGEAWSADKTTGLTGFTGTLALVGNLKLTNAASAVCTYAPTDFSVRFEDDGQGSSDGELLCDETGTASFTLAAGCSLSGEGFILCPITFAASSVIEIKAATAATAETPGVHATRISLTKEKKKATITLPSGEGKHILLNAAVASNGFLLFDPKSALKTSTFAFAEDSTLTASTAGVNIFRSSEVWGSLYDTLQVLANPPVSTETAGVAEAIRDQANFGGSPVSVSEVTKDKAKPKVVLEGALFFENVVKTEKKSAETGISYTATVTYDFGVSAITVKKLTLADEPELCVVVCAKVESAAIDGTPAVFKKSAQVQLYLNDALCNAATALNSTIDSSVNDGDKSVRWFAVPLGSLPTTGTSNFTVKVTESTP